MTEKIKEAMSTKLFLAIVSGLFGVLLSSTVSGVVFFTTAQQHYVNRSTVSDMIATEAPYIEDRKVIRETLSRIEAHETKLADSVAALMTAVATLETEMRLLRQAAQRGGNP